MSTSSMAASSNDIARVMPLMPPPTMAVLIRCLRSMAGPRRCKEARVSARIRKLGERRDRRDGRMGGATTLLPEHPQQADPGRHSVIQNCFRLLALDLFRSPEYVVRGNS